MILTQFESSIVVRVRQRCGTKCQIINLGCGFDTLYWRLEDATRAGVNFVELDFPAVTAKKCHIIKRNKRLLQKITSEGRYRLGWPATASAPELTRPLRLQTAR